MGQFADGQGRVRNANKVSAVFKEFVVVNTPRPRITEEIRKQCSGKFVAFDIGNNEACRDSDGNIVAAASRLALEQLMLPRKSGLHYYACYVQPNQDRK
jgi:hypothetical protein